MQQINPMKDSVYILFSKASFGYRSVQLLQICSSIRLPRNMASVKIAGVNTAYRVVRGESLARFTNGGLAPQNQVE